MRLVARSLASLLVLYGLVLAGSAMWASTAITAPACPQSGTLVVVDASAHSLCLCQGGQSRGVFRVALGRGGVDKRIEGDGKTPVGAFSLSEARPSSRFGLFLPVGYPSADQRQNGYTGSDIGVHGPHRAFSLLRHATLWFDWTAGCIAVATQGEIETIAAWVHTTGAHDIVIR
jgi:murein L,D-transpeptidase YafK